MRSWFLILFCLIPINSYSEPKLFSSDWPVWGLTEGMHKSGLLNKFDYRIEKYDTCLKWFEAGNVDITFMTLYDFISIQPTKDPTVIIGITDYSNGGDKLIVKKTIKTAMDLKDKQILLPSRTISLWLLNNYLKKNDLNIHDVDIRDQNENLGPLQFNESSNYKAVVGWNPIINKALTNKSYIAATSADFPEAIYDLVVAKKSFVDNNPQLVENFLSDYYDSINSEYIISQSAQSFSVSTDEYKSWLKDAFIYPTRAIASKQYKKLFDTSEEIITFLTKPPKSLKNTKTESMFRQRDIDMQSLIYFNGS